MAEAARPIALRTEDEEEPCEGKQLLHFVGVALTDDLRTLRRCSLGTTRTYLPRYSALGVGDQEASSYLTQSRRLEVGVALQVVL